VQPLSAWTGTMRRVARPAPSGGYRAVQAAVLPAHGAGSGGFAGWVPGRDREHGDLTALKHPRGDVRLPGQGGHGQHGRQP
jgi:hypothetical protein